MSKLVVVENVSLDGVMQAPGRPDEDIRGGFDRGGWATQALEKDPEAAQASMAGQAKTRALLFGVFSKISVNGLGSEVESQCPTTSS